MDAAQRAFSGVLREEARPAPRPALRAGAPVRSPALARRSAVRCTGRRSELPGDARLFQHGIGRVARQDGVINGEAPTVDRAFPYFVIALAPAYEMAVVIGEDRADLSAVAAHHQAKRPDRRSTELAGSTRTPTRMITSKGTSSGLSRKSWIIAGSLATSASRLGASVAMPMSSLSATRTLASGSHIAVMVNLSMAVKLGVGRTRINRSTAASARCDAIRGPVAVAAARAAGVVASDK